ncbi:hypothetical protein AAG612_00230 [Citromicrobium bathyomarinum]|uniref:hypothetical protein n=1 Tax=Citromicrobium bathyomarinum TaxID=72174 RepID=UPI00315AC72B
MSFREKSAWVMGAIMLATGLWYATLVAHAPHAPVIGPLIPYVLAVIVLSIVAQTVLAIASPKEANAPADERERAAIALAGKWSGIVLGVLAISACFTFVVLPSGTMLFHHVIGALIVAQLAEYIFQIYFFRRAI